MRSNLEDSKQQATELQSYTLGVAKLQLTANFAILEKGPASYFLDPNGSDRDITLPDLKKGLCFYVFHTGAANLFTVKNAAGTTIGTVEAGGGVFLLCSGTEWKALSGAGNVLETDEITSPDSSITVAIVSGTTLTLEVNEAAVDHDALLNFVADEHVAHSGVSMNTAANSGLAGGGTIAASRSLTLDVNNLAAVTPVLADSFPFYDASGAVTGKATLTGLNAILDHDALLNFVADEHIAHSGVSITGGTGLTGGGTIEATRTISLAIDGLTADIPVSADLLLFYDVGGADHNTCTVAAFNAVLDHDTLSGFVANEHIDHSSVDIGTAANSGLAGGGSIAASRALTMDINNLAAVTPVLADSFAFYDDSGAVTGKATLTSLNGILDHDALLNFVANEHVDHSAVSISTGAGLTGGGTIAATRTLSLDINGLTTETTFTSADDYIPFYDTSEGAPNKILFTNLPSFTGDSGSGGIKGLVPAPAAGDAAALKFLKADGTWATPAGGGDVTGPASAVDNAAARYNTTTGKLLQDSVLLIADTTGALSRSGGGGIPVQGTNTNDSAAAGYVGEYISSVIATASQVALTTNVAANVTSISLTAGDWDVDAVAVFDPAATTSITAMIGGINTTSATLPGAGAEAGGQFLIRQAAFVPGNDVAHPTGRARLSLNATTTVYFVAFATFTVSTLGVYGYIRARRVR